MEMYTVRLDIPPVLEAPRRCPGCDAPHLLTVPDGERVSFLCRKCGLCWQAELGWIHTVDRPRHAPGPPRAPDTASGPPATGERPE